MKILLIAPASGKWRGVGKRVFWTGKTFRFSMLSLLTVAAETPDYAEVRMVDEQVEEIPFDGNFDVVGITAMTAAAPRAYEIAKVFKERNIPVVMGGFHATFLPEEALRQVDAVCVGNAEGVWPSIVEGVRTNELKQVYGRDKSLDLGKIKIPPRSLLSRKNYATLQAVQATKGCPHRCAFCSVSAFHEGGFYTRPVEKVVEEIESLPGRFFMFVDDNLTADTDYAEELFTALIPLKKQWVSQATLGITDSPELVELAAGAGCTGLFVGLETFSSQNLKGVEKEFNRIAEYRERINLLHDHGIGVEAGVVFGFDADTPEVFQNTLRHLEELRIDMAQISILTPLPGTAFYSQMESRIVNRDWSHYDYHQVVFQPYGMSRQELKAGHDWITREFYSPARIAKRVARIASMKGGFRMLPYVAALNAAYFGRMRSWGIKGWNPAGLPERGVRQRLSMESVARSGG